MVDPEPAEVKAPPEAFELVTAYGRSAETRGQKGDALLDRS
jgi:hypothetical protein